MLPKNIRNAPRVCLRRPPVVATGGRCPCCAVKHSRPEIATNQHRCIRAPESSRDDRSLRTARWSQSPRGVLPGYDVGIGTVAGGGTAGRSRQTSIVPPALCRPEEAQEPETEDRSPRGSLAMGAVPDGIWPFRPKREAADYRRPSRNGGGRAQRAANKKSRAQERPAQATRPKPEPSPKPEERRSRWLMGREVKYAPGEEEEDERFGPWETKADPASRRRHTTRHRT